MKIRVLGKAHKEGIGKKTGKPYNFNEVHFNGPAYGVEGLAAKTFILDSVAYPIGSIQVGGDYNVEFDQGGYAFARMEKIPLSRD